MCGQGSWQQRAHWWPWERRQGEAHPGCCLPYDHACFFQMSATSPGGGDWPPEVQGPKRQLGTVLLTPRPCLPRRLALSPTREGLEHPGTPPSKALLSPVKNGESPVRKSWPPRAGLASSWTPSGPRLTKTEGFLDKSA